MTGLLLASAYACKPPILIITAENHARDFLDEAYIHSIKAATSIMAMNNIYYRFIHLIADKRFVQLPVKLHMNVIANPGITKIDLELIAKKIPAAGCYAVIVLDRAGWHTSAKLKNYRNIFLMPLPPSPELNTTEQVWQQLRDRYLANRAFEKYILGTGLT